MIPASAHFIWFGTSFPFIYALAVRSAAVRGGFERVVLHHGDELEAGASLDLLYGTEGVELRPLSSAYLTDNLGELGTRLAALYEKLKAPAARANLMRAAILAHEGGVYLDTDTITVRSFDAIRGDGRVFCGAEPVALPGELRRSRNPIRWLGALSQLAVRDLFRRLPGGWSHFRRVEGWMHHAPNNAVLGGVPGHPFFMTLLHSMVDMSPERQLVRFALGTHLLQATAASYRGDDLRVYPAPYFFPIGPELSEHWFKSGTAIHLDRMLHPDTVLVHWYASVRTKHVVPQLNSTFIAANQGEIALCRLAVPFLDESD